MKILILAVGKSGTTALLHKVGASRPEFQLFSGGKLGKVAGVGGDAIFKFTLSKHKGRSFGDFEEHLRQTTYDRKIWIARDPRDNAISRMLFRWYQGSRTSKALYRTVIDLVRQKERDPGSVSFSELMRYRGYLSQPVTIDQVVATERKTFEQIYNFVSGLGSDWFIFKYEDLIDNNFTELNAYLGFEVKAGTSIDRQTQKVARKKSTGDWRHWYTEEDVRLFKPVYTPYMNLIGYDICDWTLHAEQIIEPEYASLYLQRLPRLRRQDALNRFKEKVSRYFQKG